MTKLALLVIGILTPSLVQAQPVIYESGRQQTVMIELFTSQGCNSCPPAEEYLNSFLEHPDVWKRYIPIAEHVDYWDYLGWKDRFASPRNSSRQRLYARVNRAPTVFTPAFFVNGKNWRPGLLRQPPDPAVRQTGNLKLVLNGQLLTASYEGASNPPKDAKLNVAVLGLGLRTRIRAGENAGRYSSHEFVLLQPVTLQQKRAGRWQGRLPGAIATEAKHYALVAWVSRPGSPAPVQATGGLLPSGYFKDLSENARH